MCNSFKEPRDVITNDVINWFWKKEEDLSIDFLTQIFIIIIIIIFVVWLSSNFFQDKQQLQTTTKNLFRGKQFSNFLFCFCFRCLSIILKAFKIVKVKYNFTKKKHERETCPGHNFFRSNICCCCFLHFNFNWTRTTATTTATSTTHHFAKGWR